MTRSEREGGGGSGGFGMWLFGSTPLMRLRGIDCLCVSPESRTNARSGAGGNMRRVVVLRSSVTSFV